MPKAGVAGGSGTERGRDRVRESVCLCVCVREKMTRFGRKRPGRKERDLACEKGRQKRIVSGITQGTLFKRHSRATKLFEQTVLCP